MFPVYTCAPAHWNTSLSSSALCASCWVSIVMEGSSPSRSVFLGRMSKGVCVCLSWICTTGVTAAWAMEPRGCEQDGAGLWDVRPCSVQYWTLGPIPRVAGSGEPSQAHGEVVGVPGTPFSVGRTWKAWILPGLLLQGHSGDRFPSYGLGIYVFPEFFKIKRVGWALYYLWPIKSVHLPPPNIIILKYSQWPSKCF